MSEENVDNNFDEDSGWFSEPNVEFIIKPKEKKGFVDKIESFFNSIF